MFSINSSVAFKHDKPIKIISVFYKCLHIFYGINYGFFAFASFKIKIIANCVSVIQAFGLCVACLIQTYNDEEILLVVQHFFPLAQYLLNLCCFMFMNREATLSGFLKVYQHVDLKLNAESASYNLEIKNMLVIISCILCRILYTYVMCYIHSICLTGVWKNVFFFFVMVCKDTVLITNAFAFYVTKCRLVRFTYLLKSTDADIVSLHRIYKSICDIALKLKRAYDPVMMVSIFLYLPEGMMTSIKLIMEIKFKNMTVWQMVYRAEYLIIFESLILTLMPAIFAGMLSTQTEEIILVLHDKLLEERAKNKARDIEKFIRYVEARPLKFSLWKVIPLDANLPGMMLSFCITYLIVVIQFSHLY